MNDKQINKIVAEAATGFLGYPRHNDPDTWDSLYESILAAIEKATSGIKCQYDASQDALREVMSELTECRKEHAILFRRLTKSRAAHAEWTNVYVEELWEQGGSIKVRDAHNAAIVRREDLIDEIVGDLVRETNIFPSQVQRAKELIRERLSVKKKVMDAGLKKVEK